ncbi:MAG: 2-dehydropantoate 2-reductase [Lachnospiraceae bacterium]|nr:2-dehydropantoate 2-reductase [Lachnospiraceae bacterium]MDY5741436.1 2-dehydropantoate 2-reductase [Lachnospiraceae bacterium]
MEIRTVGIVGMGALGVLYAEQFVAGLGKEQVPVLCDEKRRERYMRDGFFSNGRQVEFCYMTPQEAAENGPLDLILFSVKYGALADAIEMVRPLVGPRTTLLSVLNGVVSEYELAAAFGREKVVFCVAQSMDAFKLGNRMTYLNRGDLCLGVEEDAPAAARERLEAVCKLFDRCRISYLRPSDIIVHLWGKLMVNVGVNQAVTLYGGHFSDVQKEGEGRRQMIAAMKEVFPVAKAEGVALDEDSLPYWIGLIDGLDPSGAPSLTQDILAGRKTEVELFSGTICCLGRKHGIPTPVNADFYRRIMELEDHHD